LKRAWSGRTRGNGFKLKEGRFILDIWNTFITMRVVRNWIAQRRGWRLPRLPREFGGAPSLKVFKARLDRALSNVF